ncbi:hypothetical protein DC20_21985 (plasmid) [Rufibacter tibetensis]|uniref:Uncharacterized protein n=1 Tax=Rufibacter tibetensis TaxID=512763 RepID=A0A0P0CDF3_9BACT|nr:hypothetical protein DC20_21985 [Rufibacter tibetensis]
MIDPEFKGNIDVYDKPVGKVIAAVKHNFKEEDFTVLSATKQTIGFFYGTLKYSMSGNQVKGWIKKGKYTGIYARNYEKHLTTCLYSCNILSVV